MSIDAQISDADTQAILSRMASGKPLDPEAYRRIRSAGANVLESVRHKHGILNIAFDLFRESRDDA